MVIEKTGKTRLVYSLIINANNPNEIRRLSALELVRVAKEIETKEPLKAKNGYNDAGRLFQSFGLRYIKEGNNCCARKSLLIAKALFRKTDNRDLFTINQVQLLCAESNLGMTSSLIKLAIYSFDDMISDLILPMKLEELKKQREWLIFEQRNLLELRT